MINYLAIILQGLAIPFVVIGGLAVEFYDWAEGGIKRAQEDDDKDIAAAYWAVYLTGISTVSALPLWLALLLKVHDALAVGIVISFFPILIGLLFGIEIMKCNWLRKKDHD